MEKVPAMFSRLFPGKKAIVVADNNTYRVAGEAVDPYLRNAGIETEQPFIFTDPELFAEWKYIEQLEAYLKERDVIAVAVGSGVINDLTKLVSSHLGRRYIIVGTAASMDGYTAYGASITFEGNKQTFDCPAPLGMVLDPAISAAAPEGDALSDPDAVAAGDVEATGKLADGLIMSGFAMQAMSSSRPASGTDHQFSHYWDMEGLCYEGKHVSHGFKVSIGTLVSTACLEYLISKDLGAMDIDKAVAEWPEWDEMEHRIRATFEGKPGHLARGLVESKGKYIDREGIRKELEIIKNTWPELREKIRNQIIPFDEVHDCLRRAGAPYEPEMIGVSREKLRSTFRAIPFMRNRFTGIDLIYRAGLMDEVEEYLFGTDGHYEC